MDFKHNYKDCKNVQEAVIVRDGKTVIWFNNWFSSLAYTIENLKNSNSDLVIIGTNVSTDCPYSKSVDIFEIEPKVWGEKYIEWALGFCKKYGIDIVFARYHVNEIAQNIERFENIGVNVVCEDISIYNAMESKSKVYEFLASKGYTEIPEYYVANTTSEFEKFFGIIDDSGNKVCTKFDHDEGAQSFRLITDSLISETSLNSTLENVLTYDNMVAILNKMELAGKMKPLMVMPKLLSPEVSVDCYNSMTEGFIAIPRYKYGSRIKEIKLNQDLIDNCAKIQKIYGFKYGFNVQFRWASNGEFKLLEINPRLSGGIHLTDMCGFSIVRQIVGDILCCKTNQSVKDIHEVRLTQVEKPVILS